MSQVRLTKVQPRVFFNLLEVKREFVRIDDASLKSSFSKQRSRGIFTILQDEKRVIATHTHNSIDWLFYTFLVVNQKVLEVVKAGIYILINAYSVYVFMSL